MSSDLDASKTMRIDIPPELLTKINSLKDSRKKQYISDIRKKTPNKKTIRVASANTEFKELFQGVYDAAFITTLTGNIVDVNSRASTFFNYSKAEFKGNSITEVILGLNDDMIISIRENLKKDKFTLLQAQCLRKDGTYFPTEISTSQLKISGKAYLCFFVRDVTVRKEAENQLKEAHDTLEEEVAERKKINEELQQAISRLKEHDEAKSQFVFNVSHELKTPLTSIKYMTSNLLHDFFGTLSGDVKSYLEMIADDCNRLTRTVEDILDMSRIETGSLNLEITKVPFDRFVQNVSESLRIQAEAQGLTMTISTTAIKGFVECDPRKMERVIYNVIKNAMKFNVENGSIDVLLREAQNLPGHFSLEVKDTGIGIPPEAIDKVTDRFFRVGEQVTGSGLGLSISKEIIEQHGGKIEVTSPPDGMDQGTLVVLQLPAAEPPTVLIKTEDEATQNQFKQHLEQHAYNAIATTSNEKLITTMKHIQVDAVCIDWTQPGMDGAITIAKIKEDNTLHAIPIFVICESDTDGAKQEILRGFKIPIVEKPINEEDLNNCLRNVLTKKKLS